jgi:hypothetical protein
MSKRDYTKDILEFISENPYGVTVTDIASGLKIARNTVYRYLMGSVGKELVYEKKIGSYTLYYSKDKSLLVKDGIVTFFKGLLANMKKIYPDHGHLYKLIGRNIGEEMKIPFSKEGRDYIKSFKNLSDIELFEAIDKWMPYFNILEDSIQISKIEVNKVEKKAFITFTNSELLESTDEYIYYFHLLMGLIEKKVSMYTEKEMLFDIIDYDVFDKKEHSNIKFSLDFQILLPEIEIKGIEEESEIPDTSLIDIDLIKLQLRPLTLAYILKCCFLGKEILLFVDKEDLNNHLINFFKFIFENSFETNVHVEKSEIYEMDKKKYKDFIVLDEKEVIKDKYKILDSDKIRIEQKIIQKFFAEITPKPGLIALKKEIKKAFDFAQEFSTKVTELIKREEKKPALKVIIHELTHISNVKISMPYLRFLQEISEHYFDIKIPSSWKFASKMELFLDLVMS